jgi:hypothetical protein
MQWWAEHLTNSLIDGKIKLRNLNSHYREIGQALLYVYKNNNFGANEK